MIIENFCKAIFKLSLPHKNTLQDSDSWFLYSWVHLGTGWIWWWCSVAAQFNWLYITPKTPFASAHTWKEWLIIRCVAAKACAQISDDNCLMMSHIVHLTRNDGPDPHYPDLLFDDISQQKSVVIGQTKCIFKHFRGVLKSIPTCMNSGRSVPHLSKLQTYLWWYIFMVPILVLDGKRRSITHVARGDRCSTATTPPANAPYGNANLAVIVHTFIVWLNIYIWRTYTWPPSH